MTGINKLLDTNFVIGLLNERPEAVTLTNQLGLTLQTIAISQLTRIELLSFWNLPSDEEKAIGLFLASVAVKPIDERVEQAAIALRRRSRLKLPDAIIGATAIVHGLTLITFDARLEAAVAMYRPTL